MDKIDGACIALIAQAADDSYTMIRSCLESLEFKAELIHSNSVVGISNQVNKPISLDLLVYISNNQSSNLKSELKSATLMYPSVPFLVITSEMTYQTASDLLWEGMYDFVLNNELSKLPFVVERALKKSKKLKEKSKTEEHLRQTIHALEVAEQVAGLGSWEWVPAKQSFTCSSHFRELLGFISCEQITYNEFLGRLDDNAAQTIHKRISQKDISEDFLFDIETLIDNGNNRRYLIITTQVFKDQVRHDIKVYGTVRDITEVKARQLEKDIVSNIAMLSASRNSIKVLLDGVYKEISRKIDSPDFFVGVHDAEKEIMTFPLYRSSHSPNNDNSFEPRRFNNGLSEHVIRKGESILINDDIDEYMKVNNLQQIGPKPYSWLGVPLISEDRTYGLVVMQSFSKNQQFSEADLAFIQRIATQISPFIKQKLLQRSIQNREKRYRRIFESFKDVFYQLNLNGEITMVTPSCVDLLGYSPSELIGQNIDAFFHDESEYQRLQNELLKNGFVDQFDSVVIHKGNDLIDIEASVYRIVNKEGKVTGMQGVIRNVSELVETRKSLMRVRNNMVEAQSVAQIGSFEYDVDLGKMVYWSNEMFKLLSLKQSIDVQKGFQILLNGLAANKRNELLKILSPKSEIADNSSIEFPLKNGSIEQWYRITIKRQPNKTIAIGTLQNVTNDKNRLELLEGLNRQLNAFYSIERLIVSDSENGRFIDEAIRILFEEVLNIDCIRVCLFDAKSDTYLLVAQESKPNHTRFKVGDNIDLLSIIDVDTMKSEALYIMNKCKTHNRHNYNEALNDATEAYVVSAILIDKRLHGAIVLESKEDECFDYSTVKIIDEFTRQISIAYERAQLLSHLKGKERNERLINILSESMMFREDEDGIYWSLIKNCLIHMDVDFAGFFLYDEERNHFVEKASYGTNRTRDIVSKSPYTIAAEDSIFMSVAEREEPYIYINYIDDRTKSFERNGQISELIVPIFIEGNLIGIIDLIHGSEHKFVGEDIVVFERVSHLLSVKIFNSRILSQIKEQSEILKIAQSVSKTGYWYHSFADERIVWSKALADIYDSETETELNFSPTRSNPHLCYVHPDDMKEVAKQLDRVYKYPFEMDFYHKCLTSDRDELFVHSKSKLLFDDEGKPKGQITLVQDITSLKLVETELLRSETKLNSILENANEITCIVDSDGSIKYVGPSVERLLGYQSYKVIGANIFDFIHPDEVDEGMKLFHDKLVNGGEVKYRVYRLRNQAGDWRYFRVLFTDLMENDFINGIVINAQDVTEVTLAYDKLEEESQKTNRFHSQLLSAQLNPHFMFNALNSIQYYILDNSPEPAIDFLSNFAKLIRLALQNSRYEFISITEEVNFLETYLKLEKLRFDNKFDFTINLSEELDEDDAGIPPMLVQPVVENAIIHGIANLQTKGHIEIEFDSMDDICICKVSDNGVGRERAKADKQMRTGGKYESISSSILQTRINLLNAALNEDGYHYTIKNRLNNEGEAEGTEVIIQFPNDLLVG